MSAGFAIPHESNSMPDNVEPPSWCQPPIFMIGQDGRGNWVVQDLSKRRGGLFVDREQAIRYIRSENGNRSHAFVAISGVFELDMTCDSSETLPRFSERDLRRQIA
jgi:hypothetical protein